MKSLSILSLVCLLWTEAIAVHRLGCSLEDAKVTLLPNRVETGEILRKLRLEMTKPTSIREGKPIDAYLITNHDAHQSQFLAERDKRLQYVSGFIGKKGYAIISREKAVIWIEDGDIPLANQMLSCEWRIKNLTSPDLTLPEWVKKNLRSYSRIGADPNLVPNSLWETLSRMSYNVIPISNNLVDIVWPHKPHYTNYEAHMLPFEFTGKTWQDKVIMVREAMKNEGCDALVITALDEISWLLNIRGKDIDYLPVIRAFILLTDSQFHVYTDLKKLSRSVNGSLKIENCFSPNCARAHHYHAILGDLKTFAQIWRKVWIPGDAPFTPSASRAIHDAIPYEKRMVKVSPIVGFKAIKNDIERKGMRNAHLKDAAAFCDFMAYVEMKMRLGDTWNELKMANTLDQFRREQQLSDGISFKTIVAFGAHSAYRYDVSNVTSLKIDNSSLITIESGGHYQDGTTQVTRTITFGKPTHEQMETYTNILKGLINFSGMVFPMSLNVHETDVLVKAPLWENGLDYSHETGHGIGSHLSVEEGPILISGDYHTSDKFQDGNFISIGPSYYKKLKYGVKLQNVLEVKHHDENENNLEFDTMTLIPFEPKLIDIKKLSPTQIDWLNKYNAKIREDLGAELKRQKRMKGFYWMMDKVQYIEPHSSSASYYKPYLVTLLLPFLLLF